MNVAYINPFLSSTRSVFQTMMKVDLSLGSPALKRPEDRLYKLYTLAAVIQLTGAVTGVVALLMSPTVAFSLGTALAKRPFTRVDDDLIDALGEIANMIAGGAKTSLPGGGQVRISTPQVIPAHAVHHPPNVPVILLPFDSTAGRFVIETSLVPSAAQQPSSSAPAAPAGNPTAAAMAPSKAAA